MISTAALWSALRASLPADIVERYEAAGAEGLEYIAALSSVVRSASAAVDEGAGAAYLLTAPQGAVAVGSVTVGISYAASFNLRLRAGALVRTADGRRYLTTADAVFPSPDFTAQTIPARSERQSAGHNLVAGQITEFARGSWVREDTGAEAAAPRTVAVLGSSAFAGGVFPLLELVAGTHGATPAAGENAETFRERAWAPSLAVTKPQLEALATRILWASAPEAPAPYARCVILEPPDVGGAWGDGMAWGDDLEEESVWTARAPWFILVMPETREGLDGAAYADDCAFGDEGAYGDGDAGHEALYWHTFEAVRRAAVAGVRVFGAVGRV